MSTDLLLTLEMHLGLGLGADAANLARNESTARVLLALDPAAGSAMGDVARRMGRDASTATRFVDRAAREGLVQREPGADRRRRLVFLSAAGRTARGALVALRSARAEGLFEAVRTRTGLGPGEVEWFLGELVGALADARGAS
jgi:DNA-binding MarR family transcriptional regulator